MVERTGLLLPLDETFTPADAEVHASFVQAHDGMREAYRQLTVPEQTRAEIESAFREGRTRNPDLTAQHLDGHVRNWQAAAQYGPGVIAEGDLGKFDITNLRHVTLLQGRGLLKPREEVRYV
ncbi:MAG TPA: hypothetical protein VFT16_02925 [Candidatus Saccharimonadales bacterium]|nr:hypothetical protein [Candidatus Saccharimonadales bacterium]